MRNRIVCSFNKLYIYLSPGGLCLPRPRNRQLHFSAVDCRPVWRFAGSKNILVQHKEVLPEYILQEKGR